MHATYEKNPKGQGTKEPYLYHASPALSRYVHHPRPSVRFWYHATLFFMPIWWQFHSPLLKQPDGSDHISLTIASGAQWKPLPFAQALEPSRKYWWCTACLALILPAGS